MSTLTDDLARLIQQGGYVIIPLLILSAVSLMLVIERSWFWIATHRPRHARDLRRLHEALRRADRKKIKQIIRHDRSPYARVAGELLDKGASDAVALEAVEAQRPRLERFMVTMSTIITAAPLLGILGTVIGIIRSFRLLGEQSTLTDPRDVSAGIAEALLTTAVGLVVALMTLFPYMVFRSHVGRALSRLESLAAAAQQGLGITGSEAVAPRAERAGSTTEAKADAPAKPVGSTSS